LAGATMEDLTRRQLAAQAEQTGVLRNIERHVANPPPARAAP
jgi:hypothetical protein